MMLSPCASPVWMSVSDEPSDSEDEDSEIVSTESGEDLVVHASSPLPLYLDLKDVISTELVALERLATWWDREKPARGVPVQEVEWKRVQFIEERLHSGCTGYLDLPVATKTMWCIYMINPLVRQVQVLGLHWGLHTAPERVFLAKLLSVDPSSSRSTNPYADRMGRQFVLPTRLPNFDQVSASLHVSRLAWITQMDKLRRSGRDLALEWSKGVGLAPRYESPEFELSATCSTAVCCLFSLLPASGCSPQLAGETIEDARRSVERAWLEWRLAKVLKDPHETESFLLAHGLLGTAERHFSWDEENAGLQAQFAVGKVPPEMLSRARKGTVLVRLEELAKVAWHWHEQWCAGLIEAAFVRGIIEPAQALIAQVWSIVEEHTRVRHREQAARNNQRERGPAQDSPPDIEDLPPCFAAVARRHRRKGAWMKHDNRLAFAKLFKGSNFSQLAFERFLLRFMVNNGATLDDVRQKHDTTPVFQSKDAYLPAGCNAILDANHGILGIKCVYASAASPCGECHAAFKATHPGKSRQKDTLKNPTQHIWWARRRTLGQVAVKTEH